MQFEHVNNILLGQSEFVVNQNEKFEDFNLFKFALKAECAFYICCPADLERVFLLSKL